MRPPCSTDLTAKRRHGWDPATSAATSGAVTWGNSNPVFTTSAYAAHKQTESLCCKCARLNSNPRFLLNTHPRGRDLTPVRPPSGVLFVQAPALSERQKKMPPGFPPDGTLTDIFEIPRLANQSVLNFLFTLRLVTVTNSRIRIGRIVVDGPLTMISQHLRIVHIGDNVHDCRHTEGA